MYTMDGIIGLGHFCETHGPIVILCTQRCNESPKEKPVHTINPPICESCKSIDVEDVFVSSDDKAVFVSTRTPLKEDMAYLLKNATVRSISCEEMGKEGGVMYFGDDQRGHVITHTFYLPDSQARGFKRKYCFLILLKDKIHLLNNWSHITKHFQEIAKDLKEKAKQVNDLEQANCSQKAARQAQAYSSKGNPGRSMHQLTGVPSIYMEIHMWFTWLLSDDCFIEVKPEIPVVPVSCDKAIKLRTLYKEMSNDSFRKIMYCFLTGLRVECDDCDIVSAFKQILPIKFKLPTSGEVCKLIRQCDKWEVQWRGNLPIKVPALLTHIENGLKNSNLPDEALDSYIMGFSYQWYNIATDISCSPVYSEALLNVLGVHKYDMPLLSYWTTQVKNEY